MVQVSTEHIALEYETGESAFPNDFDQAGGLERFRVGGKRRGADSVGFE
jgi:hypothetical protein